MLGLLAAVGWLRSMYKSLRRLVDLMMPKVTGFDVSSLQQVVASTLVQ